MTYNLNVIRSLTNNSYDNIAIQQEEKIEEISKEERRQSIEMSNPEQREEVNSQVSKTARLFPWFQNFIKPSHFSTYSLVINPFNSQTRAYSILKIAMLPHLQAFKKGYSYPNKSNPSPASSISFANWTSEKQRKAVRKLQQLDIPFSSDFLEKIYTLLQTHERSLCRNPNVSYPALFQVIGSYQEEKAEEPFAQLSCELEIHTNKKASLIFRHVNSTFIAEGSSKHVWKIFALGKPKVIAYSIALPVNNAHKTAAKEENCIQELKGQPYIAKVYRIFSYSVLVNQRLFQQQIIEMKYYPTDLLNILNGGSLSSRIKMLYSIQIMEAIANLHAKGIIHRDIKLENILIDKNGIALTDFGLSCHIQDETLKKELSGTLCYIAPEIIKGNHHKYGFALDIWSAGCVLWLLWKNSIYPWYEEAGKDKPDLSRILEEMNQLENTAINPKDPIAILLWHMLRIEPQMRWSADKVLKALNLISR